MSGLGSSNSYEILAKLASGGMAELYLARSTGVGGVQRHVVLKRILPQYAGDSSYAAMFLDEVRIAAQLRHPNIAQFYDVGRLGSSHFYTMEYVHGETLAAMIARASATQPVPLVHALTIAASVAAALHHAHTRIGPDRKPLRIVHRDVTPTNIMIDFEGAVKLLDFGVAKSANRTTDTVAGVIKGKVGYVSPEQCRGSTIDLDGRSDIFSLGVCLYELLTMHYLFQRNTELATVAAILSEPVAPPSALRKDIPPELDRIVMTALAKDREQRYPTAEALQEDIEHAAGMLKLTLSPSGLARFVGATFGQRPEPWLDMESLVPVTVITDDVIREVEPAMPIPPPASAPPAPDARELDTVMEKVKLVRLPTAHDADDVFESVPTRRANLPVASEHPAWEATLHGLEDMPSQLETVIDSDVLVRAASSRPTPLPGALASQQQPPAPRNPRPEPPARAPAAEPPAAPSTAPPSSPIGSAPFGAPAAGSAPPFGAQSFGTAPPSFGAPAAGSAPPFGAPTPHPPSAFPSAAASSPFPKQPPSPASAQLPARQAPFSQPSSDWPRAQTPAPLVPRPQPWLRAPSQPAQWNVPRLVIAGLVLLAILVAIVYAIV